MPRLDYVAVPTCQPAGRRAKGNKHPRFVLLSNQREKERGMKWLEGRRAGGGMGPSLRGK